ncbi:MAG: hypothetical protein H7X77_08000 [Anaerolineae bacterium]|nr:hypothetical protein [Anaerolineae bacterium]
MAVSFDRAKAYIYSYGMLWERVLFGHLFEGTPLSHVHQCLACYKNPDGGWGHGIEPDITTPVSHPRAMEFALQIFRTTGMRANNLFNDAPEWLETNRNVDGSLLNPAHLLDYPCAPWWRASCGQTSPASIVGNLVRLGIGTPIVLDSTSQWVQDNLTLEQLNSNDGLTLAYEAYDYFMNIDDFPQVERYRKAVIDNIIALVDAAPEKAGCSFFLLAVRPESPLAKAAPAALKKRLLSYLKATQTADGIWQDEHELPHWYPWTTIVVLNALKTYGVWTPKSD